MFVRDAMCPFCFKRIKKGELLFLCTNSKCKDSIEPDGHIIDGSKPDKRGYCVCNICARTTGIKVCPSCKSILPDHIMESTTKTITVAGAIGSGKSYYIFSLLKRVLEYGGLNSREILPLLGNNNSMNVYKQYDLYTKRGILLPPTNPNEKICPLFLELNIKNKRGIKRERISFWDASGECFVSQGEYSSFNTSLYNSDSIILLLDPLSIPYVCSNINENASHQYTSIENVLQNLIDNIHFHMRDKAYKKIKTPICIAISKWDLVTKTPGLLPDVLICGQSAQQINTGYDKQRIDLISNEIRNLLINKWGKAELVGIAEQNFETVKFFGVSAWGISENGKSDTPLLVPYRVEDPLLWILHRDKII